MSFFAFGISDFVEIHTGAWYRPWWLLAWKATCVAGFPVVFDITHSVRRYGIPSADPKGGSPEFLPVLSRAGVAAGVDGVFIETHPEPEKALCDASSQVSTDDLEEFLKPLIEIHNLEVKYRE